MNKKKLVIILSAAVLVLGTIGAGLAMSSTSFNIPSDTIEGAGAGGGVSTSAHYQLESSIGGAILVDSSSTNYEMCSGFICGGLSIFNHIFLPLVERD